jgi:hypothetical protein
MVGNPGVAQHALGGISVSRAPAEDLGAAGNRPILVVRYGYEL